MKRMEINAKDYPVSKLFGGDFLYKVLDFQRSFSWNKGNFEGLIGAILSDYERNGVKTNIILIFLEVSYYKNKMVSIKLLIVNIADFLIKNS